LKRFGAAERMWTLGRACIAYSRLAIMDGHEDSPLYHYVADTNDNVIDNLI
jgi:hypothetical protein